MSYEDADNQLIQRVTAAMWDRMNINTNRTNGRMIVAGADPDDHINPELKLTEKEIKDATGRDKLRDVVLTEIYVPRFREKGFEVDIGKTENGERYVNVKIVPPRADEVKFDSLSKLEEKNKDDIKEDPAIARPYYE
jgi:hypothetical protein